MKYNVNEPSLADALELTKKEVMLSLNCHAIATVQEFDPVKQTVKATLNYKKSFQKKGSDGKVGSVLVDYPILVDVPIIITSGGSAALTMPIAQGDDCMILFNDRDIDNWFAGGGVTKLATNRLHSFSDGVALIGLRSLAKSIEDYDATRAVLRNGSASVGVGETLIQIKNENKNLKTILVALVNAVKNMTIIDSGMSISSTVTPASQSTLTSIVSDIEGLLE